LASSFKIHLFYYNANIRSLSSLAVFSHEYVFYLFSFKYFFIFMVDFNRFCEYFYFYLLLENRVVFNNFTFIIFSFNKFFMEVKFFDDKTNKF
jgi:hypothetical protein